MPPPLMPPPRLKLLNIPGILRWLEPAKLFRLYVNVSIAYLLNTFVRLMVNPVYGVFTTDLLTYAFLSSTSNALNRNSPFFFLNNCFAMLGVSRGILAL